MLKKLEAIKNKLKSFNKNKALNDIISEPFSLSEVEGYIVERLNQQGITASGIKLRTDKAFLQGNTAYSDRTIPMKTNPNRVNLFNTGEFYGSIEASATNKGILIKADFEKENGEISDNFTRQFSNKTDFENDILMLNKSELNDFVDRIILPSFIEIFKKHINV